MGLLLHDKVLYECDHGALLAWVGEGDHERHGCERAAFHKEPFAVAQYPVPVGKVDERRRGSLVAIKIMPRL